MSALDECRAEVRRLKETGDTERAAAMLAEIERRALGCPSVSPSGARCVRPCGHSGSRWDHRDGKGLTWSASAARGGGAA